MESNVAIGGTTLLQQEKRITEGRERKPQEMVRSGQEGRSFKWGDAIIALGPAFHYNPSYAECFCIFPSVFYVFLPVLQDEFGAFYLPIYFRGPSLKE